MKILVTGSGGQLGADIISVLQDEHEVLGTNRNMLDVTNWENIRTVITEFNPDVIIHCAAWTNVDLAEDNKVDAYSVNVIGTENITTISREINALLIYISTDYVFDGIKDSPYEVHDEPHPINYYGYTKYLGEEAVKKLTKFYIIRISWVFGINGNNFVKTMLKLGRERKNLNVVSDQIGSPTYTSDITLLIKQMINSEKYGIYHATNEGYCSWYEFAKEIFKIAQMDVTVSPIETKEYQTKANRPLNSRLSKQSLIDSGFSLLPRWQDALKRYIECLKEVE